jgi:hypothetical protein
MTALAVELLGRGWNSLVVVMTLSMLGMALSVTAVVIAWLWTRRSRGT